MDLNELLQHQAPCTATYLNFKAEMLIWTERLSPAYKAELIAAVTNEKPEERKDEQAKMLSDLIASWDVKKDGEAYPPTYDNLCALSYPLMAAFVRAISEFLGDLANPQSATS